MRRLLSATVYTRLALALAATTAAVAAATTPAEAAGSGWRLVDLGTLGGACCSQATAINDHGDVVGDSGTGPGMSPRHAFLWRHGRMVDLGTLGGTFSTATDINNRRAIVGFSSLADGSVTGAKVSAGAVGTAQLNALVAPNPGQVLSFDCEGDSDNADLDIHLLNEAGDILAESTSPEAVEHIDFTFTADGTYYMYLELWYQTTQEGFSDYICHGTLN